MRIVNNREMAPEIYEAIVARMGQYSRGDADYSVTQLIDSPQVVHLSGLYGDKLEVDAQNLVSAWIGHLIHDALEKPETSKRVFGEVSGVKVSGAYDYFNPETGELKDYKSTSVWSIIYGSHIEKWTAQLNLYAALIFLFKRTYVKSMAVEYILTDWSKGKATRDVTYPQTPQGKVDIELWDIDRQITYLRERIAAHTTFDGEPCTNKERWKDDDKWAVMKGKNKRATKVYDNQEDAEAHATRIDKGRVEVRRGIPVRCADGWCDCAPWCPQYQEEVAHDSRED